MSNVPGEDLAFVRALMQAAREEGCRRVRIGEIEVEMAVVRNPLAEQREQQLEKQRDEKRRELENRGAADDYLDAMGNAVPTIKRRKVD